MGPLVDALVDWLNHGRVRAPDELLQDHASGQQPQQNKSRAQHSSPGHPSTGAKQPRSELSLNASRTSHTHSLPCAPEQGEQEASASDGTSAALSANSSASTATVSDGSDSREKDEDFQPLHAGSSQNSDSEGGVVEYERKGEERAGKDAQRRRREKAKKVAKRPLPAVPPAAPIPPAAAAASDVVRRERENEEKSLPASSADPCHPQAAAMEGLGERQEKEAGCAGQAMSAVRPAVELRQGSAVTLCVAGQLHLLSFHRRCCVHQLTFHCAALWPLWQSTPSGCPVAKPLGAASAAVWSHPSASSWSDPLCYTARASTAAAIRHAAHTTHPHPLAVLLRCLL